MTEPAASWKPLRLHQIEPRPKAVELAHDYRICVNLSWRQKDDLEEIRKLISTGGDLSRFYRRSAGTDWLLRNRAIMHLHLGSPGSDELLYLIQYPEHVFWLRVDSHIHLDDIPPGKRFLLDPIRRFERLLRDRTGV